ncbi:MAG: hypothetical protein ACFFBS_03620 [Promethearchaeota archaeon]
MEWRAFWRRFWSNWYKSKVRSWGGSKGLIIPSAMRIPRGPVLIQEEGHVIKVIHLAIPLTEFVGFVKARLENSLDHDNGLDWSDEEMENRLTEVLLAVRALQQRSSKESSEFIKDTEDVRSLFSSMAGSIEAHLKLFSKTDSVFGKTFHWQRLMDEVQNALSVLNGLFGKIQYAQ